MSDILWGTSDILRQDLGSFIRRSDVWADAGEEALLEHKKSGVINGTKWMKDKR